MSDNLTAGTSAWVNGQYVVGTGRDNKSYYDSGYAKGFADGQGSVTPTTWTTTIYYHVHSNSVAGGETRTADSYETYDQAKSGLSTAQSASSSGGCYTKQGYTATKTVQTYHPAVSQLTGTCGASVTWTRSSDLFCDVCGGKMPSSGQCWNGHGSASHPHWTGVCSKGHSLREDHTGWNRPTYNCTKSVVLRPASAAYWSTDSRTTVSGYGTCPANSNNGSTAVTYSNVVYSFYVDCGHTQGEITGIYLQQ
jgi:hypothetical protein